MSSTPEINFFKSPDHNIILVIDRTSVVEIDIAPAVITLNTLISSKEHVIANEGTLSIVFDGYNDDHREVHEITEIRTWFHKLFEQWPYFSVFANRSDATIPMIIKLLLRGKRISSNDSVAISFDSDELKTLILLLFGYQNRLYDDFDIDLEHNKKTSAEFIQACNAFFD